MNTIKVVGIDLAKNVFQVCVWMADGSVASNRKISWQKLLDTVETIKIYGSPLFCNTNF